MRVYVCSRLEAAVSEKLLGQLHIASLRINEAPCRVPEAVEACAARRPRDLQAVERRIQRVLPQHVRISSLSIR